MRVPHTGCNKGKRVRVILRTGETFIDTFLERTNKHVFLKNAGRIAKDTIRAFTIWKHKDMRMG